MIKRINLLKIFPILLIVGALIGVSANVIKETNPKLGLATIVVVVISWLGWSHFKKLVDRISPKWVNISIVIFMVLLVIVQFLVVRYLAASVWHDPFRVMYQAELLSKNNFDWNVSTYFWRYPNNVAIAFLLAQWLKFTTIFGLGTNAALHILSLLLLDGFIILTLMMVRDIAKGNGAFYATMLFFAISPFAYSYYLQVFYSDMPSLLVLLVIFNIIRKWGTLSKSGKYLGGLAIILAAFVGQLLKPTLLIVGIAGVIMLVATYIKNRTEFSKLLTPILVMLVGLGLTLPAKPLINAAVHFTPNTKYEIPMTSWIYMSYNAAGRGMYVPEDVKNLTELPTKADRSKYLSQQIPKRLNQLGWKGIIKQWFNKARTLLKVGTLQRNYMGGFIAAPSWYQNRAAVFSVVGEIIMRAGMTLIYIIAILKSITLIKSQSDSDNSIEYLAIITIMGYLAFHTFLWEVESRYGQALFPLLLLFDVSAAVPMTTPMLSSRNRNWLGGGIIAVVMTVFFTIKTNLFQPITTVAAQLSQMSIQYDAELTPIKPQTTVTQKVKLNRWANSVTISVRKSTKLSAKLVSLKDGKVYRLHKSSRELRLNRVNLASGKYNFVLTNNRSKPQKIQIVKTQKYRLTPYPIKIGRDFNQYGSLIYSVNQIK